MTTKKERVGRSILACLISTLGPVSFGYCLAYSSSALVDLSNDQTDPAIRLSDSQGSWFSVSIFFFICAHVKHSILPTYKAFFYLSALYKIVYFKKSDLSKLRTLRIV